MILNDLIRGKVYVLGDKIDTDNIIPAEHLSLDEKNPTERKMIGSKALSGLPSAYEQFITPEDAARIIAGGTARFQIIVAGRSFGCGSSREYAPVALGAAGVQVILARSYARIFYNNSFAGGEVVPCTTFDDITSKFQNGDDADVNLVQSTIVNLRTGQSFGFEDLGYRLPQMRAGGLFAYARQLGLLGLKGTQQLLGNE